MNKNNLLAERADVFAAADALIQKARASKTDLEGADKRAYDALISSLKTIDGQIAQCDELVASAGRRVPANPFGAAALQTGSLDVANVDLGKAREEMEAFYRGNILAADTPLYIQTSPTSAGLAAAIPTEVLAHLSAYYNLDSFGLAGASIMNTDSTVPLVKPVISAGPDAEDFVEGESATESHPFATTAFTFGGKKFARLVKVSEEALMNTALPLSSAITDELLAGVATTFTKEITTAMLAAFSANSSVLVAQSTNDVYKTLLSVMHSVPPRFDTAANAWMLSRASLAKVKDQRATDSGVPFFDPTANQIFGRKVVINDNLTAGQVVYGSWLDGCFVRKSPFILLPLRELYSAQGQVGFKATQFLDQHFLAELSTVTVQPLYYTVLG